MSAKDETWEVVEDGRSTDGDFICAPCSGEAELIAAAPDMARLLLAMEYVFDGGPDCIAECHSCKASRSDEHSADCEWVKVAKKAGLR